MRIIYIDDDATNRSVLQHMLAGVGLKLAQAADAETGLRMLREDRYDLVIMDLRMPGVSGVTAIRQIRSREAAGGHLPVLVTSAELSVGVRELCRTAGADGFVEKPIVMAQLFDAIGQAVAGQAMLS